MTSPPGTTPPAGAAASNGHGLRLTLSLAAAPRLLSVPWELLYRRPRFFANQRQTPLVRHLDTPGLPQPPAIDGDRADARRRRQPDGLRAARRRRRAGPRRAGGGQGRRPWVASSSTGSNRRRRAGSARRCATAATTSCTTSATATSRPTAKGCCTSRGRTARHATVDSTELANLLADQTSLRLVVLNSCEGARTTLTDPYAGVATTLVQLGVPAVVAMQFEISDEAAILFAEELYTNLIGRQDPIDAAVAEARKAIYIELGTIEWATPVLFMGDVDVELFRFEVAAAPLPPPPPPSAPLARSLPNRHRRRSPQRRRRPDRGRTRAGRRPSPSGGRRRRSLTPKIVVGVVAVLVLPFVIAFIGFIVQELVDAERRLHGAPRRRPATDPAVDGSRGRAAGCTPPPLTAPATFAGTIDGARRRRRAPAVLAAGQVVYIAGSGECASTVDYHLATPSGSPAGRVAVRVQRHRARRGAGERHATSWSCESFAGGAGPYSIEAARCRPMWRSPVTPGQPVSGEITTPGEHHLYTFDRGGGRRRLPAGERTVRRRRRRTGC